MTKRKSLLDLRDKPATTAAEAPATPRADPKSNAGVVAGAGQGAVPPSRQGKKAMTGYFSPELSTAVHITARKNGMSLQDAMGEALNDWLRKMGESPVGL